MTENWRQVKMSDLRPGDMIVFSDGYSLFVLETSPGTFENLDIVYLSISDHSTMIAGDRARRSCLIRDNFTYPLRDILLVDR